MKILSVSNPQWADAAHTMINALVDFEGLGTVPFTAAQNDTEAHGAALFAQAAAGDFGGVAAHVEPTAEELAIEASNEAEAALVALDLASIRYIREYIASKPDAPQILKDRESQAAVHRAKVIP